MKQKTILKSVEETGIGLHKGMPIKLRLEPMEPNSGIVFYRKDIAMSIKLHPDNVVNTLMATVIGDERGTISTIEHLLSAVYAYGIDNLRIIVDGDEVPIMDGSAISYCLLIEEAGIKEQEENKKIIAINKEVSVKEGGKYVKIKPSKKASFNFTIDFPHPAIGKQSHKFIFDIATYKKEIARARTFGFMKDLQYLQSQNLALGAGLNNAIGLDDSKILNPEGLRYDNEFVRHKILDAMGDLMVSGYNVFGAYESVAGSHKLNNLLLKKIFEDEKNYEIISFENKEFEETFSYNKVFN